MQPHLTVTREDVDGATILRVVGDIDAETALALEHELFTPVRESHLIVDLSGVQFLGARALHLLEAARNFLQARRQNLLVVVPPRHVARRLFEIARYDPPLVLTETIADAVKLAQRQEGAANGSTNGCTV